MIQNVHTHLFIPFPASRTKQTKQLDNNNDLTITLESISDHIEFLKDGIDGLYLIVVFIYHSPEKDFHFLHVDLSIVIYVEFLNEFFDLNLVCSPLLTHRF